MMFKDILVGIVGVHVYPLVSLILFVAVFGVVLVRVARLDRAAVQRMAALPLEPQGAALAEDQAVAR
jgi:hypothetical protein